MSGEIIGWLNEQHPWIQEASKRLLIKGVLADEDISDLVAIVKSSILKSETQEKDFPRIERFGASNDIVRIVSIGEVQGIENLAPRNPLVFGSKNLCVIYGYNGSGKSGYVRILKKACGKRGASALKPNVYKPIPTQQHCTITYDINGASVPVRWGADDKPISDLEYLDIFDTLSGRTYLDGESEPSYVPAELALFADLVNVCRSVGKVLDAEQSMLVKKLPELPLKFVNTEAGAIYAQLSFEQDQSKLETITSWIKEDSKNLNDLQERLKIDDPSVAAHMCRKVKEQIDQLASALNDALSMVDAEACSKIMKLRELAIEKRKVANDGVKALSTVTKLDGVGSDTWRVLWFAARDYSTSVAYNGKTYPNVGLHARCVLCQQELDIDPETVSRLNIFESFITNKLQSEAEAAEIEIQHALKMLPAMPRTEALKTACQAAELSDEMLERISDAWLDVQKIVTSIQSPIRITEIEKLGQSSLSLIADLSKLSEANKLKACQYDDDAKTFNREEAMSAVLELQAKEWTAQQAVAINVEIDRLKKIHQYDEWKRLTSTTGISMKAGVLSETLITDAYVDRFNSELQILGAKNISVELIKTRVGEGSIKHQIRLKGTTIDNIKVAEVLSEGEQRIVSLAAFLADVTGKSKNIPFIFDDPVSSLDQIYEEKTIDRLVELSRDRQVLIFTHRLSFLGMINHRATPNNIQILNIRCEPWGSGELGEIPIFGKNPDNVLKDLKNDRLAKAKRAYEEDGSDAYYPLGKALCSDIRILMERIVETILLGGVVERHRRELHTKEKICKLCKIKKEDCDLVDEIMTKYSRYEHSQSSESPVELLSPEELAVDLDKILSWCKEFEGRTM